MKNQCQHSTETQRNKLLKLLQKFKELFDVTPINWKHRFSRLLTKRGCRADMLNTIPRTEVT